LAVPYPNQQSTFTISSSAHTLQYSGIGNSRVDLTIEGVSQEEEDSVGGLLPVNLHFQEQNKVDPFANPNDMDVLVPDNQPDLGANHRIVPSDPDLRRATVTIDGKSGSTGTWRLEFDPLKIKFWRRTKGGNGYIEVLPNVEEPVTLPYTEEFRAEGIQADPKVHVKLVFTPTEPVAMPLEDDVKLKLFEYWIQDVTTEPGTLPIVNPSGVGINKTAVFKLTRLTESTVPPDEIEWTVTAGAAHASVEGANKGRSVTMQGISEGDVSLTASWRGFKETIAAKVVPERSVDVSVVIVSTDNQPAHNPYHANTPGSGWTLGATAADVQTDIDRANDIFRQWNITYNVKTIVHIVLNSFDYENFFGIPSQPNLLHFIGNYEVTRLGQDIDPANSSVEVYYFRDFGYAVDWAGVTIREGVGIRNLTLTRTPNVPAHEFAHVFEKNGPPSHQPQFLESLMYPRDNRNGGKSWDISLPEGNAFINFHSDW
jgi:hypothetical protein